MSYINFCTLFNKNYLTRGLVTHKTLMEAEPNAYLYIFAFDDETFNILEELKLERTRIVSLREFEDNELLKIKPSRSFVEYCWTCTPSVILFAIEKFNLDSCTYIDSDMYFLNSPKIIIDEIPKNASILLTEHRYTKAYDATAVSGRFCVQFMTFKNTITGIEALRWWRDQCIEWCYFIAKDGKLGDQGYIQDWETRFEGVHVMQNLGGGLAPWNIQQYDIIVENKSLMFVEKETNKKFLPIFYHFHYLRFYSNTEIVLSGYPLSHMDKVFIYYPYVKLIEEFKFGLINKFNLDFDPNGATELLIRPINTKDKIKFIVKRMFGKGI